MKRGSGEAKVINLFDKLEKKVEKQLAGFVREIVRLQKAQEQLHKTIKTTIPSSKKTAKPRISKKTTKKRVQGRRSLHIVA